MSANYLNSDLGVITFYADDDLYNYFGTLDSSGKMIHDIEISVATVLTVDGKEIVLLQDGPVGKELEEVLLKWKKKLI